MNRTDQCPKCGRIGECEHKVLKDCLRCEVTFSSLDPDEDYCYIHRQDMNAIKLDYLLTVCESCGQELGAEVFLCKYPVCGKCVRKRHNAVVGK